MTYEKDGIRVHDDGDTFRFEKTDGSVITNEEMNRVVNTVFWGRPEGRPTAEELAAAQQTIAEEVLKLKTQEEPPCPVSEGDCACLDPSVLRPGVMNACSAIHFHFGLSYASYLVLRRSMLQSMPLDWQAKFVSLLNELDEAVSGLEDPVHTYQVASIDGDGAKINDPYFFYDRGRRRIPLKGA